VLDIHKIFKDPVHKTKIFEKLKKKIIFFWGAHFILVEHSFQTLENNLQRVKHIEMC